MKEAKAAFWVVVIVAAQMPCVLSLSITAPAFLWSPHRDRSSYQVVKQVVEYRTISPKDLAKSVLSDGGWSNLVCSGENLNQNVDIALVFIGRRLQSSDISKTKHVDPALLDLLKVSFTSSNFSMAFPYIALSDEKDTLENSLISGFISNCGHGVGVNRIAYLDSCSVNHEDIKKLQGLHSFLDFVSSRKKTEGSGQTNMVVFCSGSSEESDQVQSEGEILSELVNLLEQSGAKYTVLYASNPYRSLHDDSHLAMSRFLAESTSGNTSVNSICDGVCQIKSSLLEGIFVVSATWRELNSLLLHQGIVLLIILISGLCCMMGIDTPTRFETPQES